METNWFVYIVRCKDATLYTGVTTDPEKRVIAHNAAKAGAKYTKMRRPVELVYVESGFNRSDAHKREAVIKKLSKAAKEELVLGVDK
ncbi:endonuclease [Candidatus Kaiserbacteria bacterium RIFCSPLOWO2_02_FULL_45_11b]|uniref:Endonuclease n=1 Tax=Candidatus Kaiserbacteria bacterium RIFCSPLOWO2_12_FULL_45_26 TaxID=1798525 RepID=A0A1F6FGK7_9BACT|nr:MAG: endonuclease [Candidatus Kaiserbacteria bacterium RIFCSPHIGHO2_12_45_16]OGG71068.1 MAG: endonuclease [Candidatus Kaiserbacteria bacterium RIFCSPLOWO2_01_FULL_45_25]OGG83558.1 MAG: endonuclease [Candidatus Kaiserbacteria bacterium RIFCSPLOWO2_02_FULL_45_11b]OGG84994.1 MAG: endonuclease [Candidatus Kaiserbacteria bacterium RIFCSPLOWO2_12_FULL_45_26]